MEKSHQDEDHEARIGKVLVIQQGHSAISSIRQSIRNPFGSFLKHKFGH
jgi:hypothetical protein